MLYFDRIEVSEGIGVNNTSKSKEYDICQYWYFLKKGLKFQPYVRNRCHDLLIMPMDLSDIAILKITNAYYCCIVTGISKSEAIKLLQNVGLPEKSGNYKYQQQF